MIEPHAHEGNDSPPIDFANLIGFIGTVSTAPSNTPRKKISEQIKIYKNGATKRLYIYDFVNGAWSYATLT
jgi:hypothetical protein